jgi:hypothetical protein
MPDAALKMAPLAADVLAGAQIKRPLSKESRSGPGQSGELICGVASVQVRTRGMWHRVIGWKTEEFTIEPDRRIRCGCSTAPFVLHQYEKPVSPGRCR